ncbi:MAG: UbiA family prenyltransferase [Pseudomonadales bacterium]|nr:UbiA family prenyltransferase [Pseudomonadales bacterium]
MPSNSLTLQSPWVQRFMAWVHERFALPNALLFFILYATTAVVSRQTMHLRPLLHAYDVLGALVTWSFFLTLRILDEHKDYSGDCLHHPERVLQQGLITLRDLRWIALLCVLMQVGFALVFDAHGAILIAWGIMATWTVLMTREFFIADWLTRHLTWYAISHMLVMPLIVFWLARMAVPSILPDTSLITLMLLAFASGFCFEITRKTKGPEEEQEGVDSYSKIFGPHLAAKVIMGLVSGMLLLQSALLLELFPQLPLWMLGLIIASWAMALRQVHHYQNNPSSAQRKANEKAVAMNMLMGYGVIMAVCLTAHGT